MVLNTVSHRHSETFMSNLPLVHKFKSYLTAWDSLLEGYHSQFRLKVKHRSDWATLKDHFLFTDFCLFHAICLAGYRQNIYLCLFDLYSNKIQFFYSWITKSNFPDSLIKLCLIERHVLLTLCLIERRVYVCVVVIFGFVEFIFHLLAI